ncbi:MAG: HAD-IA family hydrolase [Betaproteobacteria bacterium]|nr:HAD-IA family hydrolase [Betaproteobacteria bacterium]
MTSPGALSAVIVDMDGTLLDLHFDDQVWNHALPRRIAARTGMPQDVARAHVAQTIAREQGSLRWYCLDHWSEVFATPLHEIETEQASLIRMRPGTARFLAHLRERSIPLILATNAHPRSLRLKLERTGMAPFFSTLRSSHDYGSPKEQAAFWDALQSETGFEPEHTLFVDDNLAVLRAARDWGIAEAYGVLQPSSSGARREFPDFPAVDALDELNPRCQSAR